MTLVFLALHARDMGLRPLIWAHEPAPRLRRGPALTQAGEAALRSTACTPTEATINSRVLHVLVSALITLRTMLSS